MTYMSSALVPEAVVQVADHRHSDPNPHVFVCALHGSPFWSGDYKQPHTLGGEIEFYLGGQPIKFGTTTSFFIPKGLRHGPVIWEKYDRPHMAMTLVLGCGDYQQIWGKSGIDVPKKELPVKTEAIDYERYVIRSPMGELGDPNTTGRTYPSMTYMSRIRFGSKPLLRMQLALRDTCPIPHPGTCMIPRRFSARGDRPAIRKIWAVKSS